VIDSIRSSGRPLLSECEAKQVLAAYGIPAVETMLAQRQDEALNRLENEFGPVLMFGAEGRLVEVPDDHALGLPPLDTTLARRLMEQARIHGVLTGSRRKKPVDVSRTEELLVPV